MFDNLVDYFTIEQIYPFAKISDVVSFYDQCYLQILRDVIHYLQHRNNGIERYLCISSPHQQGLFNALVRCSGRTSLPVNSSVDEILVGLNLEKIKADIVTSIEKFKNTGFVRNKLFMDYLKRPLFIDEVLTAWPCSYDCREIKREDIECILKLALEYWAQSDERPCTNYNCNIHEALYWGIVQHIRHGCRRGRIVIDKREPMEENLKKSASVVDAIYKNLLNHNK
jgi:hypothetical protein